MNPTLPQYTAYCLAYIMANWQNYYTQSLTMVVEKFKMMIQVIKNGLDPNTVYLFEVNYVDPQDLSDLKTAGGFDPIMTVDGKMVINPIDPTLPSSVTIHGTTFYNPANNGQKEVHGEFYAVPADPGDIVNCTYAFTDAVIICTKV